MLGGTGIELATFGSKMNESWEAQGIGYEWTDY